MIGIQTGEAEKWLSESEGGRFFLFYSTKEHIHINVMMLKRLVEE
jgi:hypothetical protein